MLKTWLGQEIGQRKDEGEHGVESPVMFETLEPRVLMNASPVGQVTPTPIASSTQPVVVQDVNGTQLTVSLSGHGSWQITQGPNGLQLTVTGTDANSQLTLTTSTPGSHHGSGGDSDDQHSSAPHFLLNSIDIKGAIGAVSGQDVDVQGNFTAEGAIGDVSLGDFKANSQFNLLSSSPTSDIDLGNATDLSLAAAGFIGNLEVESWISDGNAPSQITGTGIGQLSSEGDFGASLSLSGAQQTASNGKGNGNGNGGENDGDSDGQTLGSVSVGGQITGGLWYVVGNTGAISAGSVAQSWDGDFTSSVGQIATYGDFDGQIATPKLENLQVGGNLSHALLLIGADLGADGKLGGTGANADHFGPGDLDQLSVGGSVIASRIRVGVDPVDGVLDDGTNTLIGGTASDIEQFSVEHSIDSASSIVAGAFPHQVSIGDQRINPLADGHFHTSPIDLRPTLTAQLVNDTGTSSTDGITSVDTIAGKVVAADGIGKLVAGFDGAASPAFADITKQINADGTFTLTPALLAQIAGGTLADGVHTLHLVATDVFGSARAVDVHFTLATKAPSVTAHLAHDTGTSATDGITSDDTISGSVTAFTDAIVKFSGGLDSASASTFADLTKAINPDGSFTLTPALIAQIAGGVLADGPHTLHLTASDQAGNSTAFALTFTLDTASPGITITSAPPSVINNPGFTITGTVASTDAKFGDTVALTAQLAGQKGTPLSVVLVNGSFTLTAAQIASLAGATKLADGAYTVQLTATDAAGNTSTRTVSFSLEATPPTITVANAPASFTNNANVAITGTVTSPDTQFGDTLTLTAQLAGSNATPLKLALNNGAFTLTAAAIASLAGTTSLADGSYNVQLTATDVMGNTSTKTISFTLATAATVLNVTNAPPSFTNNPNVAISGSVSTADAKFGDAVTLTAQLAGQNGTPLSVTLNNGAFTLTAAQIASISGATSLADGTYAVQLTATDAAGNATTKTVNFTLATAAPVVTITGAPSITNNANLTIGGTVTTADAQFGDTVALTAQLAGSTSKLNVALNNGAFTLTAQQLAGLTGTTKLADGVYTVNLTATDAAGNTSTKAVSFTLDTQAPNLSASLAHDTGVSATDGITSDDTVVGKITDSQHLMVELRAGFDGTSPANFSNIALNPDGSFTLTPAQLAAIAGGLLADGSHTLHLVACDQAGNLSSFDLSFTLDGTPPALSAGLLSGNGGPVTGDDTILGTVTDAGSGLANLTAGFDGAVAANFTDITASVDNSSGLFILSPTELAGIAGGTLSNGAHTLHLVATDVAGNVTTEDVSFTLDVTGPSLSATLTGGNGTNGATNNPTFAGTVTAPGGLQNLFASLDSAPTPNSFDLSSFVQADGTFTIDSSILSSIESTPLTDGAHTLQLEAIDNDGVATSFSVHFTLGSQGPVVSAKLANAAGSGAAQAATATTDTIIGNVSTEVPLASFTGHFAGTDVPSVDLTSLVKSDGSFTLSPAILQSIAGAALQNGLHTLDLVATDTAGNTTTVAVTFNLKALAAALKYDTGASATDGITNDSTINGVVSLAHGFTSLTGGLDGAAAASFNLTSFVNPDGTFTLSPATLQSIAGGTLADGAHTLHLASTDGSGNVNTFDVAFTLVTQPPVVNAALSDSAAVKADGTTSDPSIAGKVSAIDRIVSLMGGLDGTATANFTDLSASLKSDGTFSLTPSQLQLIEGGALANGAHTLHLMATDAAGNTSTFDVNFNLLVIRPVFALAPGEQNPALGPNQVSVSSVTLIGSTLPDTLVTLNQGNLTTTSDQNGRFEFDNVNLKLGSNLLTAETKDAAGNVQQFTLTVQYLPQAQGDAVLQWNQIALNTILLTATDAVQASRELAMESIAISDSIAAIEGTQAFLVHATAPSDANESAAVDAAAFTVLNALNPGQAASLNAQYQASLAQLAGGQGTSDGIALGQAIANQVLALRANDGSGTIVDAEGGENPGQWRPTGPNFGLAVDPQFASVAPFLMSSPNQFLSTVAPPPSLASAAYAASVNEVDSLGSASSTTRTADQTQSAQFWAGQDGTYTVAGQWNQIASVAAQQHGNSLAQDAKLFTELNVGLADTGIATSNAKYNFNFWSPVTALQNASQAGNPAIQADPSFQSLITTPEAPEYVETQSAFSSAAATILDNAFGSNVAFTATASNLPGVARSFSSFDQAAAEAGRSGIYAGTDFQFSNVAGQGLGSQVGSLVVHSFDFTKTTNPPKIVLDQANPNIVTNKNPTITGDVFGISGNVASLSVSIDGAKATAVSFDQNGRFSLPLNFALNGTQDGAHSVTLVATDSLGNQSGASTIHVTLATTGPKLSIASLQDGASIADGAVLQGNATSPVAITSLCYKFDNGTVIPVQFDTTNGDAFNQALNLSQLSAGAHKLTVTATDAAGNVAVETFNVTLAKLVALKVTAVTPADGDAAVGVTSNPLITFSRPVDPSTLNSSSIFLTDSAGNVLSTKIVPWADNMHAWVIINGQLPGNDTITIHINGAAIKGLADGAELDAAGTGQAGSVFTSEFTTVSTTPVANTTISGVIMGTGPDLQTGTPDQMPLAGVTVYVLGQEQNAVVTDAQGRFTLTNAPAGDVKVITDGRTAINLPAGVSYPELTVNLNVKPGQDNTIEGSRGTIASQVANADNPVLLLPRLATNTITNLNPDGSTVLHSTPESSPELSAEQLQQLSLTIAPNSLVDENGNPMPGNTPVAFSLIPASTIKNMLPDGLTQHSVVVTVQIPGLVSLTTPAALTVPNTLGAAAGSKLNLLTFDYATGETSIVGTGTVSADGKTITTDPGCGITKSGWDIFSALGSDATSRPNCNAPLTTAFNFDLNDLKDVKSVAVDLVKAIPGAKDLPLGKVALALDSAAKTAEAAANAWGPVSTFGNDLLNLVNNPSASPADVYNLLQTEGVKAFSGGVATIGQGVEAIGKIGKAVSAFQAVRSAAALATPASGTALALPASGTELASGTALIAPAAVGPLTAVEATFAEVDGFTKGISVLERAAARLSAAGCISPQNPIYQGLVTDKAVFNGFNNALQDGFGLFKAIGESNIGQAASKGLSFVGSLQNAGNIAGDIGGALANNIVADQTALANGLSLPQGIAGLPPTPNPIPLSAAPDLSATSDDGLPAELNASLTGSATQATTQLNAVINALNGLSQVVNAASAQGKLPQTLSAEQVNAWATLAAQIGQLAAQQAASFSGIHQALSNDVNDFETGGSTGGATRQQADAVTGPSQQSGSPQVLGSSANSQTQITSSDLDGEFSPNVVDALNNLPQAIDFAYDNIVTSPPNAAYMVTLADGQVIRGTTDKSGAINVFLPPDTAYTIDVLDSRNLAVGTASGMTSASGVNTDIPPLDYSAFSDLTSTLNDGVPDVAKEILGVDPTSVQPIVPGLSNLAAIQNGLNAATVNSANVTGVVGGVALQGSAQAVAISASTTGNQQTAYVATTTGLAIIDVTNHTNPTVESQITLGGDPRAIAVDSNLQIAAVASGTGGLQLINVADPSNPTVLDTIPIDATQVQIANGIVYANDGAALDAFDLATGQPLQTIGLGSAQTANGLPDQIIGLTTSGSTLFAATHEGLFSFAIGSGGTLSKQGEVNFPVPFDDTFSVGSNLTVSNGIAYIAAADASVPDTASGVPLLGGYLTVNVSDPSKMAVEGSQDFNLATAVPGARVAVNGSGIGVTIGSAGARSTTNELDVFDASDPTKVNQFITAVQLPGSLIETPSGLALDGTTAFVADGSAGLQIVNYESLANGNSSAGPSIQITSQPTTLDPTQPGLTLVEGQQVSFGVKVSDTSPVTSVQLLALTTDPITGAAITTVLQNNVNAPFDLNASTLPLLASLNGASLSLEIRATDAAGHVSTTAPIAVTLLADTTPPNITSLSINDGATRSQAFQDIEVNFSKPLDPNTVNASTFAIIGPDGKPLSGVTATLAANGSSVQVSFNSAGNLPVGAYQLQIDDAHVQDLFGVAVGTGVSTTHFNVQDFSDVWVGPQTGGVWSDAANWSAGRVPGATDNVLINSVSGGLIFMNGTDQVASLTQIGSGTLTVTEGGSLTVAGQTDLEGTLVVLTGCTFNADDATTIGSLLLTGGTLGGTGAVNLTGPSTIQSGQMVGTGTTIAQGTLSIVGGVTLAGGRTFQANGVTNWTNGGAGTPGFISSDGTAKFINQGTLNANSDGVDGLSADGSFTNEGKVVIGSGTSLSLVGANTQSGSFSGSGSLTFADGTASLTATSSIAVGSLTFENETAALGGTITVGSGDQLVIDADQRNIVVTGSITGAGNVQVNAGSLSGSATSTFAVTGTTTLNNGTITLAGPATLGTLDLVGGTFEADGATTIGTLNESGGKLTGTGTVTVTGATASARPIATASKVAVG
jgi:hypothetical protein